MLDRTRSLLLAACTAFGCACGQAEGDSLTVEPMAAEESGESEETSEDDGIDAGASDDTSAGDASQGTPDDAGTSLFDPTRVSEMRFEVSEESLAQLRADADQPMGFEDFTYVEARLTYDGSTFEKVALRVKGNNSRSTAKGDAVPFKVDINEYVEGQKLDGQTKFNLHNNGNQPHGMSDYLSYAAFRAANIAASRTGWADVYLNGTKLGLYTVVEQVDDKMLARWYDEPKADLYKPEPQSGFLGYSGDSIDDYPTASYEADNETDHATFLDLVKTISEQPVSAWDAVIDVESVLAYLAGNVALGNWDTYVSMGHNYYLFEATPGRMVMLPWDMNLSQSGTSAVCASELRMGGGSAPGGGGRSRDGGMPPDGFPGGGGFPDGGMFPGGGFPGGGFPDGGIPGGGFPGGGGPGGRSAPLYDGLMQDPTTFARYLSVLQSFLDGPGSAEALLANIDVAAQAVGDRIETSALEALRTTIRTRVTALEAAIPSTTMCASTATSASATTQP